MITKEINIESLQMKARIGSYVQLLKLRLTLLVVFSAAITFAYAAKGQLKWSELLLMILGGILTTGSANSLNQIIEKDTDKLMHRTQNRPMPNYKLSITEALTFAISIGVAGIFILTYYFNLITGILGLFSIISYAFIYTPLKLKSSFAVFVGAIAGAMPPLLGYVAYTNKFGFEPGIMFAIQFIWQFPHFWAIAWVLDEDYRRANIFLLPSKEGRGKSSALQIMLFTLVLIPVSLLPIKFGMAGTTLGLISILAGLAFFMQSVKLYKECSVKAARELMFGSFIYLPVVQIILLIDKL
ncbi:MAG: protoheme farnesyltransferase [Bacteroidota bacterium]|jgi:protoheme IX farnesyltransferase